MVVDVDGVLNVNGLEVVDAGAENWKLISDAVDEPNKLVAGLVVGAPNPLPNGEILRAGVVGLLSF